MYLYEHDEVEPLAAKRWKSHRGSLKVSSPEKRSQIGEDLDRDPAKSALQF